MQDRPTADELLHAVQSFLEKEIVPQLHGRQQFHARVAANVVAIVRRELALQPEQLAAEWRRLAKLLGRTGQEPPSPGPQLEREVRLWTQELCDWIRTAPVESLLNHPELWQHLEATTREKLQVANPRLAQEE